MLEQLKNKAVHSLLAKLGEPVQSAGNTFTALVHMQRLDSRMGKTISTRFKQITLYVPEASLSQLGETVTVRGVEYEVVTRDALSEYNGFARIQLVEPNATSPTGANTWR